MSPWIISHSARRKIYWGFVAGSLWDFEMCFNRLWVDIWMSSCLYFNTRRKSTLWKSSSIRVWRHWLMYVTSHEKGAQYFYFGCQSVEWLAAFLHHLTARRGSTQQIRRWSWFRRWERLFESQCWKCICTPGQRDHSSLLGLAGFAVSGKRHSISTQFVAGASRSGTVVLLESLLVDFISVAINMTDFTRARVST